MKITPAFLASLIEGKVEGDENIEITGFAKIEEAKKGDISFIANMKYAHFAATTEASALLVADSFEAPESLEVTLIRVKEPYVALARLMSAFNSDTNKKGIEQPSFIGENSLVAENCYVGAFAYIGKNVKLGKNVQIYPHVYIGDNCEIGDGSVLMPHVTVYHDCVIGKNCVLHSGSVVGADGFGFALSGEDYIKIPQIGRVVIEDDVEIGANTTIDRATMGETRIGRGTKLDNLIQVAHNVTLGSHNVIASQTGIAGSTKIGDRNRIGGQVGFSGHIKFGNDCEVGAKSGIHRNFGDKARIIGYPATDIKDFGNIQLNLRRIPRILAEVERLKKEKQ